MKLLIGNTKIEFRTDYCSAENQKEIDLQHLQRMSRIASIALAAAYAKVAKA